MTGFDQLPPAHAEAPPASPVLDDGGYRRALREGRRTRRAMFARLDGDHAVSPDGGRERVDAVLPATGYRPNLFYLTDLAHWAHWARWARWRTAATRVSAAACH
ncbi:hypothetical protein AB0C33_40745 [Nonomuraea sp. NPDC048881]|uniref:hypothetical protein n=1 Tax=Nonomuraea sp. NPDC048881 TaxID=3155030 RepID=UPI0033CEE577